MKMGTIFWTPNMKMGTIFWDGGSIISFEIQKKK